MTDKILAWCEKEKVTYIETKIGGFYYINTFGVMAFMPFDDME